jgi:hypothetical protein
MIRSEGLSYEFLKQSLRDRAGRRVMLFQYLPPFEEDPEDSRFTSAAIPHAPRTRLLATCVRHEVAAIACGHLHVYRQMDYRGIQIVWAPATSFFNTSKSNSGVCAYRGRATSNGFSAVALWRIAWWSLP